MAYEYEKPKGNSNETVTIDVTYSDRALVPWKWNYIILYLCMNYDIASIMIHYSITHVSPYIEKLQQFPSSAANQYTILASLVCAHHPCLPLSEGN
jgi:hypothetical protein